MANTKLLLLTILICSRDKGSITFLYPPQRGYISFVNTFVTLRNNDLGPYVPWRQRKILRHLSYVCLSVRRSVCGKYDCVRKQIATDLKICKLASITHTLVGIENGLYIITKNDLD